MIRIVTSNPGKLKEYQSAFNDLGLDTKHVRIPYVEVQSSDLEEVVLKGMEELRKIGLTDFLIDDSGLFVDRLGGFPGVYSAYAQKTIGNKGILDLMRNETNRNAEFRCCIGCDMSGETVIVTGICKGTILNEECGEEGFGFDPLFSVDGERSFSEIPLDEKNEISHRGIAIKLLIEELKARRIVR